MTFDFIIIGSGLAGLTSSLVLSEYGSVLLVNKGELTNGASSLAQGGVAAAVDDNDSSEEHIRDTLEAGAGHNDGLAVRFLAEHGPEAIVWLEEQGVVFDRIDNHFMLGKEGAHSHRRILRVTDFTGRNLVNVLAEKVKNNRNITIWEGGFLLDLLVHEMTAPLK